MEMLSQKMLNPESSSCYLPVLGLGAVERGQGGLQPSVPLQQSCAQG